MSGFEALRRELTDQNVAFLNAGQYQAAQEVTSLLQELSRLQEKVRNALGDNPAEGAEVTVEKPETSEGGSREAEQQNLDPEDYPRFVRRGDVLVKIGLKRDKRSTYEQKLSRNDFEIIRDSLLEVAQQEGSFDAPKVINRAGTPSYLVYFVLALLQEHGLVGSPTRGRYRFKGAVGSRRLDEAWSETQSDDM